MKRLLITQRDTAGSFYAHTVFDTHDIPAVVRSDGRLFALDPDSVVSAGGDRFELTYNELDDADIVEL